MTTAMRYGDRIVQRGHSNWQQRRVYIVITVTMVNKTAAIRIFIIVTFARASETLARLYKDNSKEPHVLSGEEIRKPGGESIYYVTCGSDIPARLPSRLMCVPSVSPVRGSS